MSFNFLSHTCSSFSTIIILATSCELLQIKGHITIKWMIFSCWLTLRKLCRVHFYFHDPCCSHLVTNIIMNTIIANINQLRKNRALYHLFLVAVFVCDQHEDSFVSFFCNDSCRHQRYHRWAPFSNSNSNSNKSVDRWIWCTVYYYYY